MQFTLMPGTGMSLSHRHDRLALRVSGMGLRQPRACSGACADSSAGHAVAGSQVAHTDVTLDDLWLLDLQKLQGWRCVKENTAGEEAFADEEGWETDSAGEGRAGAAAGEPGKGTAEDAEDVRDEEDEDEEEEGSEEENE